MQLNAVRAIGTQVLSICGKIINFSLVNIPILGDIISDISIEAFNGLIARYKYKKDLQKVLQNVESLTQDEKIGDKLKQILMELVVPEEVELTKRQVKRFERKLSKSLCNYAVSRKLSDQKVDEYLANSKAFSNMSCDDKQYIVNAIEALIQIYIKEQFDGLEPNERVLAASINESFEHGIKNLESILIDILNQISSDVKETKADVKAGNAKLDQIVAALGISTSEKTDDEENIDFEEVDIGNADLGSLFKQMAEGNAEAEFKLAQCFYKGVLVAKSENDAVEYYKKSASHGYIKALYNLGLCAEYGIGVTENEAEAFGYYKSAAEAGHAKAQFKLAECFYVGLGVECDEEEAVEWYKKAAENGDGKAQAALGLIYFAQDDEENEAKMIDFLSAAERKGETLAVFMLAGCYTIGKGVEQDLAKAYELYLRAADSGDDDAQFMVGLFNFEGILGVQNFEEAFKWFNLSAEKGNGGGQAYAGLMYMRGIGVEENVKKGWELISKSVAQDSLYGNGFMAVCKSQGMGCDADPDSAFYFAQRAARQGNIEALYLLGAFYFKGVGCGSDRKKGLSYIIEAALKNYSPANTDLETLYDSDALSPQLKKFVETNYFNVRDDVNTEILEEKNARMMAMIKEKAESGDAIMQCQYARLLINGIMGVEKDISKGIEMLKAAKSQDCLQAYADLATCYFNGIDVEEDDEEALKLAEYAASKGDLAAQNVLSEILNYLNRTLDDEGQSKSVFEKLLNLARRGNRQAQYYVGHCYRKGRGVEESKGEAFKWFLRAAKQDDGDAQYFLASCYEKGEGTDRDSVKAVIWYAKAAEKGNGHAKYRLGELISRGQDLAVVFYFQAAYDGVDVAKYKLGYCYEFGKGIEVDLNKALKWYKEAADDKNAADDDVKATQEAIARVEEKLKK